jgi:hypothetical protein
MTGHILEFDLYVLEMVGRLTYRLWLPRNKVAQVWLGRLMYLSSK